MDYTTALESLNITLIKHHLAKRGLLSLSWEELNEDLDRDISIYNISQVRDLSNSLTTYLQPYLNESDMKLLEVELASCGLCISIPPIPEKLVEGVMEILHNTLTEEDIKSLNWDVCNKDGSFYW